MTPSQNSRRHLFRAFLAAAILLAPNLAPVARADTTRDLQHAVHRLNIWLGKSDEAEGWRRYLNLNSLETQAAKGNQADVSQLSDLLDRFSSDAKGLDAPPFNDVRIALRAQLTQLSQAMSYDLFDEARKARFNYQQISITRLQQRRDKAVYDLRLLKKFYKGHLHSRNRALVYYDLRIDELIEFLEGLQFELPPDISVGKLNDQMSAVKEKLDDLELQRDQLPEVEETPIDPPQPDDSDKTVPIEPPGAPTAVDNLPASNSNSNQDVDQDVAVEDDQMTDDEARRQRAILNQQIQRLTGDYDQIKRLRDEVRKQDLGRQRERVRTWREMGTYTRGFVEVGKRRSDYFFQSSYHSFSKFALLYFYGTDDNLQAKYNGVLDTLEQELSKLAQTNDRNAAVRVIDAAGWLEATELAPNLLSAIQARHSTPNIKISASNNFVNRVGPKPDEQTLPVNEQLFGRLIRGIANSSAKVTIDFIEDPHQARISIRLRGQLDSKTHTQSGSITAFAGAIGNFEARQNVTMNVGGLFSGDPYVAATIASEFYGISSQLGVVQNIAQKLYERDRVRNEAESARRLEQRVLDQYNDQADDALSNAVSRFKDALEKAVEIGDNIPEVYVHTTHDRLVAVGHKSLFELTDAGRVSNLASPVADQGTSVNADVAIQLHESLLSNYVDPFFVNRTFTNDELATWAKELTGELPEGLATDEEAGDEPWSITFARVRPIQIEFENNSFAVTITGRRFTQGDSKFQAGLKIRVPFKIMRKQDKLILVRDGAATIDYVDPDKKTAKLVAFKSLLETKLNSENKKKDDVKPKKAALREGIELPENLVPIEQVEQLKEIRISKAMRLVELRMINGWLYAGWNYVPEGDDMMRPTDTPAIWYEFAVEPTPGEYIPLIEPAAEAPAEIQIEGSILDDN